MKYKKYGALDKNRTMDDVQKHNSGNNSFDILKEKN
jgi:hypothetical protein